ncbi:hypothetical protein Clacol_000869 [Clathrus columnatus]|uniref:Uncharacterized protein n=1 Tax=Clathrus columnatus TaxID=1419009 RepID=A0AAV4ZXA9_9AGAM|nr:hypothetical protein Clacol_000869 [Clathrus columnatus]
MESEVYDTKLSLLILQIPYIALLLSNINWSTCARSRIGYRPMALALCIAFMIALGAQIYHSFTISNTINDIAVILLDLFAFIAVMRQVWGLWRLKRSLGLQSTEDLVTSLLRQDVFFRLSTLIICEFTLELRRRNTQNAVLGSPSAMDLPTLSFRENPVQSVKSMFERFHENIMAEMGEGNNTVGSNDGLGTEGSDDSRDGSNQVSVVNGLRCWNGENSSRHMDAIRNPIVDEASDRESHHIRNIEDYFKIRRDTIGAKPSCAICEMYMNIPEEVIGHDMIIIRNDLYSYNVEQARGDEIHNLVTIIILHELKLDIRGESENLMTPIAKVQEVGCERMNLGVLRNKDTTAYEFEENQVNVNIEQVVIPFDSTYPFSFYLYFP